MPGFQSLLLACLCPTWAVAFWWTPCTVSSNVARRAGSRELRMAHMGSERGLTQTRAQLLTQAGALIAAGVLVPSAAPAATDPQQYSDATYGMKFTVPANWQKTETDISGRRKLVVYTDADKTSVNAFVAYTPLRGDFTSLGSFGTLDDVARSVLPTGPGISSYLIDASSKNRSYFYDYTVAVDGRPEKHLKTVWAVIAGETLITFTAQCDQADYPAFKDTLDGIVGSIAYFQPAPKTY